MSSGLEQLVAAGTQRTAQFLELCRQLPVGTRVAFTPIPVMAGMLVGIPLAAADFPQFREAVFVGIEKRTEKSVSGEPESEPKEMPIFSGFDIHTHKEYKFIPIAILPGDSIKMEVFLE